MSDLNNDCLSPDSEDIEIQNVRSGTEKFSSLETLNRSIDIPELYKNIQLVSFEASKS